MEEKYDIIIQIGYERYVHKRMTLDDMREIDWNDEMKTAITQAEYDNKD
jgi:hypothetical protein